MTVCRIEIHVECISGFVERLEWMKINILRTNMLWKEKGLHPGSTLGTVNAEELATLLHRLPDTLCCVFVQLLSELVQSRVQPDLHVGLVHRLGPDSSQICPHLRERDNFVNVFRFVRKVYVLHPMIILSGNGAKICEENPPWVSFRKVTAEVYFIKS